MKRVILAATLLMAVPGFAHIGSAQTGQVSGQSVTQPSENQNNPQAAMNGNNQPPQAHRSSGSAAVGQQVTQPSANQNQPQTQTNNNNQPGHNVRTTQ